MAEYIDELIVTVIVCRIVNMTAPDGETKRRYLAAVCALLTLLALIAPLRYLAENADGLISAMTGFFTLSGSDDETETENSSTDSAGNKKIRTELSQAAAVIFAYAEEKHGFDTTDGKITFYTDEKGEVTEAAVFFMHGTVADCEKLRCDLLGELGIEVHVYTGDVNDGTK